MQHFVQDSGLNLFRLREWHPSLRCNTSAVTNEAKATSWQFLINSNTASGSLDATNAGKFDQLVQACLATGAHCMIDLHNFARFNGAIIGQGGPSDDLFIALWAALAAKYAAEPKIIFGLTNEPHDLDVRIWAQTCQKVVTAIRNAGALTQLILLPGTNFDSAATLVSSGSAEALMNITNPDHTTTGLLLDVHKYLDVDNSGTHANCTTDNVGNFTTVAEFLRERGRQGLVSETGASSQASCLENFCAQNRFINDNADVFVGYVGWAAGAFDTSYVLSLTPSKKGKDGGYVDNTLMTQCVLGPFRNASTQVPSVQAETASAVVASVSASVSTSVLVANATALEVTGSLAAQTVAETTFVLSVVAPTAASVASAECTEGEEVPTQTALSIIPAATPVTLQAFTDSGSTVTVARGDGGGPTTTFLLSTNSVHTTRVATATTSGPRTVQTVVTAGAGALKAGAKSSVLGVLAVMAVAALL